MNPAHNPSWHHCAKPQHPHAFTLIELLVAMAIVGVLAALGMSVLTKMQASSRKVTLVSNMKQLGAAVLNVATENEGVLPLNESVGIYNGYTRDTRNQLSLRVGPYLGLPRQEDLSASGPKTAITVPQLCDPGIEHYYRGKPVPSSVPQFVQPPGLPSPFKLRRPFGRSDGPEEEKAPLRLTDFTSFPQDSSRWLLSNADQKVTGLTSSWKKDLPPSPVHGGVRFRLYDDGRVSSVAADAP